MFGADKVFFSYVFCASCKQQIFTCSKRTIETLGNIETDIFKGNNDMALLPFISQKMRFSNKDFFSKCYQIHRNLRICLDLLEKCSIKINLISNITS